VTWTALSSAFGPLERRLFLSIVAGLLPLAVLALITLLTSASNQKRELLESSQGAMRAILSAIDAELEAAAAALDALAASPRLASDDLAGFYLEAQELLNRRPKWANIVLSDSSGNELINARIAPGDALPSQASVEGISETVRAGRPQIGNVIENPVLQTYGFAVQIPIPKTTGPARVLSAVLRPEAVREILQDLHVPENGVVGVMDRQSNVVARTLNHEETVGRPASASFRAALEKGSTSGWVQTSTIEGLGVYTVFDRSSLSGWTAGVGIPSALIDAPARRSYLIFGGLIAASVLLGVFTALLVSRAISQPMRELKLAAQAMGGGNEPSAPTSALPEIRDVAAALVAAHRERETLLFAEREARAQEHEARMAAERANRMKDEFLAMLGHELRNPLAAITSASLLLELAADKPDAQALVQNAVGVIRRQSRNLSRLTDDLLDAARVVLGRIQLDCQAIELSATVNSCVETLRATNALSGHTLTVALEEVWIAADATRIEQIVTNLLANAVRYTPSPGIIEVRVEKAAGQAKLCVRDSGIGVEPELMPRIFDLFVQGERAPDRSQGGLGIGLTMVRRLSELHGGSVSVASEGTGRGSEFTVVLPSIAPPLPATGDTFSFETRIPRSIVIVEDNADVRASLRQILELGAHSVAEATDGNSGVALIARIRPDLAIIDIGLPFMDGYSVARTLRSRAETRSIFLVAISGYGTAEDQQAGAAAGFDAYVVKPIDEAKLRDILQRAASSDERRAANVVAFSR
jgi:signal transduction histidine kinase/ActR/RegA family two-component response regulator